MAGGATATGLDPAAVITVLRMLSRKSKT